MLISWQKMKWSLGEWQGPECETLQECGGSDQGELDLEESIRVMNTCPWSVGSQGGSSLVHFTCSDMSDCLWPHGLQHARLPCPSPTIGTYSNSCWSSQWGIIAEKSETDSVLELKVFQAQILLVKAPNLRSSILLGPYILSLLSKYL